MIELIYIFGSVLLVSLISLVGIVALLLKPKILNKIVLYLVSFSAGALLGGAFIHLIPEAFEAWGAGFQASLYVLLGIVAFFIMEKIIHWRHCHIRTSKSHPHPFTYLNLIGDGVHNFFDGMIIAGSYLVSIPLGFTTTLAVILHEIPQEIGDFGVLVYGGFTRKKALIMNLLSALTAFLGAGATFLLSAWIGNVSLYLVPFTAGGFIYIAGSDLIPELKKDISAPSSFLQLIMLILGIALMLSLALAE